METVSVWLEEIKQAKKREKKYFDDGGKIIDIYEGEEQTPFNILYSNTEVMLPALFSSVPRPVIQRRFKDEDPLGKQAATASQRMLEYLIDTDLDGNGKFEDAMLDATLDALLPGRGISSIKYDSDIEEFEAEEGEEEVPPQVKNQTISMDSACWDRVYFGYAKKWVNVPWMAYEIYIDEEEAKELFPEKYKELKYTEGEDVDDEDDFEEDKNKGKRKTATIYQVWCKQERKVFYISAQYDDYLKEDDDPLELTGFFNCPEPIQFLRKTGSLTPTAPYKMYENQAKELNRIQLRLNNVIEAIKVRGVYDGSLGTEIESILKEDDNALVPAENTSILNEGGFSKSIWFLPIAELTAVAQQLYQARESAKRVIYEITGISDIIRGQSMASETLGAQKIKEAWGTMRLKRLQKRVQSYALDSMKMMLEVAVLKFDPEVWRKITGMPLPMEQEKGRAKQFLQMAKQQKMPQDHPEVQKAMDLMKLPAWEDILKLLKDDYWRSYRLDIETNSTLDVEATEDKQNIAEFMNAFAQLLNGIYPMVEKGAMPFDAAKAMMLSIVKRYRFGREVEDQLKEMVAPKPPENKEAVAAQKKFQQEKQKFEDEKKKAGEELDTQYRQLEMDKMQFDFEKKLAEEKLKMTMQLDDEKQQMAENTFSSEMDNEMEKHKREIQSMLDKTAMRMEKLNATV